MSWIDDYSEQRNKEFEQGGDIEVECRKCRRRFWVWNDPSGTGAGFPFGWQFLTHLGCGGAATPVGEDDAPDK